jgi:hypothetical protein
MKPVPRPELLGVIREKQAAAVEDDWRAGKIQEYLDMKKPGEVVCLLELWTAALGFDSTVKPMAKKDSTDLGQIIRSFPEWVNTGERMRLEQYGRQRVWKKVAERLSFPPPEMPFGKKTPAQNPQDPPPKFLL